MKDKTFNEFWEELKAESPETKAELEEAEKNSELMMDIMVAVRDLLDEKDSEKWISVEDLLPDTNRDVLTFNSELGIYVGFYGRGFDCDGEWYVYDRDTSPKITHWRELPDPPRMEECDK